MNHDGFIDETLNSLREAVSLSPQNIPLRQHLGEYLLNHGQLEAAEKEFREALALAPEHHGLKLGLARAFYQQGKKNHAFVLLEDWVKQSNAPAKAHVLFSRLLVQAGEIENAVIQYKKGIEKDSNAADSDLANRLGISSEDLHESQEVVDGRVRASWEGDPPPREATIEKPRLTFKDVGGMETMKEEIRLKIIYPLLHPEMYKAYGKATGGGILLYGPPGCGKTHLARATAGEIKAGFIAVGINEVLDMWIGQSERNLHELFEQARRNKPCVLFFDEVDALGASRSDLRQHAGRQLINQFLAELDGIQATNDGVLILAATNAPWHLDSAFRRPGRFDRIMFVPPPDAEARAAIIRLLCQNKPMQDIDFDALAKKTERYSGADLKAMVDIAIEDKLKEAMKLGTPRPLTTKDLTAAISRLKPTTQEWFATARNYALYSNQGGLYDDILKFLKIQ